MGDKNGPELASAIKGLANGYSVASINYRLSGEAKWPAQINDVKAAIRFLRANAALQDGALGNPGVSDSVQAVIDMFGPVNFLAMDEQFKSAGVAGQVHNTADSPESALFGKQLILVPELVRQANPETYISTDDPPFFIQHRSADTLIPTQQFVDLQAALAKTLGKEKVTFEVINGAGHGTAEFSTDGNTRKVFAFLDTVLK